MQSCSYRHISLECQQKASPAGNLHNCGAERKPSNQTGRNRRSSHKLVLYFLAAYEKINLPRYLMHHLCWAIKEGIKGKRKQIPCGRLLSEIFTQGKLLETLRRHMLATDCWSKP